MFAETIIIQHIEARNVAQAIDVLEKRLHEWDDRTCILSDLNGRSVLAEGMAHGVSGGVLTVAVDSDRLEYEERWREFRNKVLITAGATTGALVAVVEPQDLTPTSHAIQRALVNYLQTASRWTELMGPSLSMSLLQSRLDESMRHGGEVLWPFTRPEQVPYYQTFTN